MMTMSDNELISTYLDGEMNDIERMKFEKRLQQDDALANRFAEFQQNDLALKEQFSEIDEKPIPDTILSMLEPQQAHTEVTPISDASMPKDNANQTQNGNVVQLSNWRAKKWLPMAASFLVIALAVPLYMQTNDGSDSELAFVLNQAVSGTTSNLSENRHIHLSMSFSDTKGRFCREYILSDQQLTTHNVACQVRGNWQTQISEKIILPSHQQYQPASGELSPKVEAWLDQNMASDPLSMQQETQRLKLQK